MACCYQEEEVNGRIVRRPLFSCCASEEDGAATEIKPVPVSGVWNQTSADEVVPEKGPPPPPAQTNQKEKPPGRQEETRKEPERVPEPNSVNGAAPLAAAPVAPPAPTQAPDPPMKDPIQFNVTVDLTVDELGLKLYVMPMSISISLVRSGAVQKYNNGALSDNYCVRQNDFIKAVNGKIAVSDMIDVLKTRSKMTLTIYRPVPFKVVLNKQNSILGCRINAMPGHSVIYVNEVLGGATSVHNAQVPEELQVKVHDCFIAVNGAHADVDKMVAEFQDPKKTELELSIVRPPALAMK